MIYCKTIAGILCLCLIGQLTLPTSVYSGSVSAASEPFEIPPGLGRISEYVALKKNPLVTKDPPAIIFIQDAHDSLDAQQNIAKLIDWLVEKKGVQTVFEEGYEGFVPTEEAFSEIPSVALRCKISDYLLDELRIGGAEYAHINRKQDFRLIGADDDTLHRKNVLAWRKSHKLRELADKELKEIQGPLEAVAAKTLSPPTREWLSLRRRLDEGKLNLDDYLSRLRKFAPQLIDRFLNLMNDPMSFPHRLVKRRSAALSSGTGRSARHDFRRESMDPRLKIAGMTTHESVTSFFENLDVLEDELSIFFTSTPEEKNMVESLRLLSLFQKFTRLELSFEEYAYVKTKLRNPGQITTRLATLISQGSGKTIMFSRLWEKALALAATYYELAEARERAVERALVKWQQEKNKNKTPAILVYGGFHSAGIRKILHELEIPFVVVAPQIQSLSERHIQKYREGMNGGNAALTRRLNFYQGHSCRNQFDVASARAEIRRLVLRFGETIRSEARQIVVDWENAKRVLVISENTNALAKRLWEKGKQEGKKVVRFKAKDAEDIERLKVRLHIKEDGTEERAEGDLYEVIKNGGILFIEAEGAHPTQVETYNSLFDDSPFWKGIKASKDHLQVVITVPENQLASYANTLYSRSLVVTEKNLGLGDYQDPIEIIEKNILSQDDQPMDSVVAVLKESPRWREFLTGRPTSDLETGKTIFLGNGASYRNQIYGQLEKALRERKPLVIRGGRWQDAEFRDFIREVMLSGRVTINGVDYEVPAENRRGSPSGRPQGFQIQAQKWNPEEGVSDKKIRHSQKIQKESWVMNTQTHSILFSSVIVDDQGLLLETTGLLDSDEPLRLHIDEDLDPGIWHEIMHSEKAIEIEVSPGVAIPTNYQGFVDEKEIKADASASPNAVEAFYAADLVLAHEKLKEKYPNQKIIFRPVTPSTSESEIVGDVELEKIVNGIRIHRRVKKAVLRALEKGDIVVLEGIDQNPILKKQLAGLFTENPYFVVNGKRVWLRELKGKLILLDSIKSDSQDALEAREGAESLNPGSWTKAKEEYQKFLLKDEAIAKDFNEKHYDRMWRVFEKMKSLPHPRTRGLSAENSYPTKFRPSLAKLRLLYRLYGEFKNWNQAFEYALLGDYRSDSEITAYLRVQVKLAFYAEEPGRPKGKNISRKRATALLNQIQSRDDWLKVYWQAHDLLDMGTLISLEEELQGVILSPLPVGRQGRGEESQERSFAALRMTDKEMTGILLLQKALIKDVEQNPVEGKPKLAEYFRDTFDLKDSEVKDAPEIVDEWLRTESDPKVRLEILQKIARASKVLMLKGSPGTGKSFILKALAQALGYQKSNDETQNEVFGSFTTGSDVTEDQVLGSNIEKDGTTVPSRGPAGRFAESKRGILLWDEANLAQRRFHRFINDPTGEDFSIWMNGERFSLSNKVIVMTGNDERNTEGRHSVDLVDEEGVTLFFEDFEPDFFEKELMKYLQRIPIDEREEIIKRTLELHQIFKRMNPGLEFSIRELQEAANRILAFVPSTTDIENIIFQTWLVYRDRFDLEEREALRFILSQKYDVDLGQKERDRIKDYQTKRQEWAKENHIALTDETAEFAASFEETLYMRDMRRTGKLIIKGKISGIILGPSGWGKDYVIEKILYALEGETFYLLNASLDDTRLEEGISTGREEGAIVALREMNFLRTGVLEGRLNDVTQDDENTDPGFLFLGTLNGADFAGRNRVSSPFLSRSQVSTVTPHTLTGNRKIALVYIEKHNLSINASDLEELLKIHQRISARVQDAQWMPTATREIETTLELLHQGHSLRESVKVVYGPVFFDWLLKNVNQEEFFTPSEKEDSEAEAEREDTGRVMQRIAEFLLPHLKGKLEIGFNSTSNISFYDSKAHRFVISTQAGVDSFNILLTLIAQQLFIDRATLEKMAIASTQRMIEETFEENITEDLVQANIKSIRLLHEDLVLFWALRNLAANPFLPRFHSNPTNLESRLTDIVKAKDTAQFYQLLAQLGTGFTARDLFRKLLLAVAQNRVNKEELENFHKALNEIPDFWQDFYSENPIQAVLEALPLIDQMNRETVESDESHEINYRQWRVSEIISEILKKMESLSLPIPQPDAKVQNSLEKMLELVANEFQQPERQGPSHQDALAKARKSMDEQKSASIEKELDKMEQDLAKIEIGILGNKIHLFENYQKRLNEIDTQLDSQKSHPYSVIHWLEKLEKRGKENPDIHQKIEQIKSRINAIREDILELKNKIEEMMNQLLDESRKWSEGDFLEGPGLEGFPGFGNVGGGGLDFPDSEKWDVGPRYDFSPRDYLDQPDTGFEPLLPTEEELHIVGEGLMKESKEKLEPEPEEKQDERWQKIRHRFREVLQENAQALYNVFAVSGDISSISGALKFETYKRTQNLEASRKSRGAVISHSPYTIAIMGGGELTPFQQEIFDFLFELGFEVAIVVSQTEVISHLTDISLLRAALKKAKPTSEALDRNEVERALREYKIRDPLAMTLSEIQSRLEKGYLYGAFRLVLDGELPDIESPQDKAEVKELSFEEQKKRLQDLIAKWKKDNVIEESDDPIQEPLGVNSEDQTFSLYFTSNKKIQDIHLAELNDLGITQLTVLSLWETSITDKGLSQLRTFTKLSDLWLSGTKITDKGLRKLSGLTQLTNLWLNDTLVTNEGLSELTTLSMLSHLQLEGTSVTENAFEKAETGKWGILSVLLSGKTLNGVQIKVAKELSFKEQKKRAQALRKLWENTGYFNDPSLSLNELKFDEEQETMRWDLSANDQMLKDLSEAKLTTLVDLRIAGTASVTNDGLKHLNSLKNLTTLYMRFAEITNEGILHLSGLQKLQYFSLIGTKVTEDVFEEDPSGKGMTVHLSGGSLPNRRIKKQAPELSLEEQKEKAKKIVMGWKKREGHFRGERDRVVDSPDQQSFHLQLEQLHVGDEELKTLAEAGFTKLTSLSLGEPKVTNQGLSYLSLFPNLITLDLAFAPDITDDGLIHLRQLPKLKKLDLSYTKNITNQGLVHLKNINNLNQLWLRKTNIDNEGLKHLKNLTELKVLDLEFTKVTDQGIKHLKELTKLKHLFLNGTSVTDAPFEAVEPGKGMTIRINRDRTLEHVRIKGADESLRELSFEEQVKKANELINKWKAEGIVFEEILPGILLQGDEEKQTLSLNLTILNRGKPMTDEHIKELSVLKNLTELRLLDSQVTDKGLEHLARLTNLWGLSLSLSKGITNEGIQHLSALQNLKNLNLQLTPVTADAFEEDPSGNGMTVLLEPYKPIKNRRIRKQAPELSFEEQKKLLKDLIEKWKNEGVFTDTESKNILRADEKDQSFSLNFTHLKKITDVHLKELAELRITRLRTLTLSGANITDLGIRHLSVFTQLTDLWLGDGGAAITNKGLRHLSELNLRMLGLMGTGVTADAFDQVPAGNGMTVQLSTGLLQDRRIKVAKEPTSDELIMDDQKRRLLALIDRWKKQGLVPESQKVLIENNERSVTLNLSKTKIGNEHLKDLAAIPFESGTTELEIELNLNYTEVTGEGILHLVKLTSLTELHLLGLGTSINEDFFEIALPDRGIKVQLESGTLFNQRIKPAADLSFRKQIHRALGLILKWEAEGVISDENDPLTVNDINQTLEFNFLGNTNITDKHLKEIVDAQLANVSVLRLGRTSITDNGLMDLKRLPKLTVFNASLPFVSDKGLESFRDLTQLTELHLGSNRMTNEGLKHLAKLTKLTHLTVNSTQVTNEGLSHLKDLTNLIELNVSSTEITSAAFIKAPPGKKGMNVHFYSGFKNDLVNVLIKPAPELSLEEQKKKARELIEQWKREGVIEATQNPLVDSPDKQSFHLIFKSKIEDKHLKILSEAGFTKLTHLRLVETKTTNQGLSYLSGLPNLKELVLHRTQVSDEGLVHLNQLTKLERLHLSETKVTDKGVTLLRLENFTGLYLHGSQVTEKSLEYLKNIKNLDSLGFNFPITQEGLKNLVEITTLKSLVLPDSPIQDEQLGHLKELSNLRTLVLADTEITNQGLIHLKELTNLQNLNLDGTKVTDEGLKHLVNRPSLKRLGVKDTDVTPSAFEPAEPGKGMTVEFSTGEVKDLRIKGDAESDFDEEIEKVEALIESWRTRGMLSKDKKHLEKDSAAQTFSLFFLLQPITDEQLKDIQDLNLKYLTKLTLNNTLITDAGLGYLTNITQLRKFSINDTKITDLGVSHLSSLTELRMLHLHETSVTDKGLKHLKKLKKLETLYLFGAKITNDGIKHLASLTKLERLFLRDTAVTEEAFEEVPVGTGIKVTLRKFDWKDASDEHGVALIGSTNEIVLENRRIIPEEMSFEEQKVKLERLIEQWKAEGIEASLDTDEEKQIFKLAVMYRRITDTHIESLADITNLTEFTFSHIEVTEEGLKHLAVLLNLTKLFFTALK